MDFNNFINNLCSVHDSFSYHKWNDLLGEMPSYLKDKSFEEKNKFFSEMYYRTKYLLQNVGESYYYYWCYLNNPFSEDKSFTAWINFELYKSAGTPWYDYENEHHSFVEKIANKNYSAPWRFKQYYR